MLTGELPLGRFAPPSKKVEVDVRLDDVVLRSLEKEPERRYQQASDVKSDVERISATAAAAVPPPLPTAPPVPPAAPASVNLQEARAQVRGPAIALLITGVIHCLSFSLVLVAALSMLFWRMAPVVSPHSSESRRGYSQFPDEPGVVPHSTQPMTARPTLPDGQSTESTEERRDSSAGASVPESDTPDPQRRNDSKSDRNTPEQEEHRGE
jgi:hypothetical protein